MWQESGLSRWIGDMVTQYGPQSLTGLTVVASLAACCCTNLMSNVAVANILLPTLACAGPARGKPPLVLLAPVAWAVSLALLFPIGTPPNAIVMANGNVTVIMMAKVSPPCA